MADVAGFEPHGRLIRPVPPLKAAMMNIKTKSKSHTPRFQPLLAAGMLLAGLGMASTAGATTMNATIGGIPSGANHYQNFDSCPLGGGTCAPTTFVSVSFAGDAQMVQGALKGRYAAPFLSSSNGTLFGDSNNGPDTTHYLSSGSTNSVPGAAAILTFAAPENYIGLLWGSVDIYNTLTFYNGSTVVGTFTGADVNALASGNQGANGTFYVNINMSDSFTRVVATSTQYAFELDNVAYNSNQIAVPEPDAAGIFLLGLLLVGAGFRLKARRLS